jgi:uncharacterized protein (TIRG00374 family)
MDIKIKKRLLWAMLFSICFMVFLLMRVDWKQFSFIAGRLDMRYLIFAGIIYLFANLVRAFRFCKLDHNKNKLTYWWHINAFYNLITSTLPGGAGEATSAYVLKRFSKINLLSALRILLLSRLMDLFALSALFFVAAIYMSSITPYRVAAIWFSVFLFLISLLGLLRSSERFVLNLMQRLPGKNKIVQRVCEKMSKLLKIRENQSNNNLLGITLFQSVLMMIGSVISIDMALRSVGVDVSLVQIFYCYGVYAIFQIVPVQGVAGIGSQAAWWALALNAAGYHANDAIAVGFILYGIFYIFVIIMGFFSLLFWLQIKEAR